MGEHEKIYKAFLFSIWSKDQQRRGIRLSSWARRVESPLKFVWYVKENENTDRCGRGRVYSSDNQIKKPSIYQKKSLHKKEFKIGQATPKNQGPGWAKEQIISWPWGTFRLCFASSWWLLWESTLRVKGLTKGAWSSLERVARWH